MSLWQRTWNFPSTLFFFFPSPIDNRKWGFGKPEFPLRSPLCTSDVLTLGLSLFLLAFRVCEVGCFFVQNIKEANWPSNPWTFPCQNDKLVTNSFSVSPRRFEECLYAIHFNERAMQFLHNVTIAFFYANPLFPRFRRRRFLRGCERWKNEKTDHEK